MCKNRYKHVDLLYIYTIWFCHFPSALVVQCLWMKQVPKESSKNCSHYSVWSVWIKWYLNWIAIDSNCIFAILRENTSVQNLRFWIMHFINLFFLCFWFYNYFVQVVIIYWLKLFFSKTKFLFCFSSFLRFLWYPDWNCFPKSVNYIHIFKTFLVWNYLSIIDQVTLSQNDCKIPGHFRLAHKWASASWCVGESC